MELFRRKQKVIFWIVTLIIVPSFVLVWGVRGGGPGNSSLPDFEMGKVNGKSFTYNEYEAFSKRIQAALGGMHFQFTGAPGVNTPTEDLWKMFFTYALLQDAEKAGATASDLQIGTYLENQHPTLMAHKGDRQALERAVNALCSQMQLSRQDFLRGVREWQTIANYLDADSNLAAVNESTIFTFYSLNKSEIGVKRVQVLETEDIKNQAKKDVMEKPAADLESDVRAYVSAHSTERRYRDPSTWRLSYLFIPNGPDTSVREPSDTDIQDFYDSNKTYLYSNKPLEEVRDQVKAAVRKTEIERQTLRNFQFDVDPQLRAQTQLDPAELVKLTQLAKYGAVSGDTGSELLPPAEVIKKLPAGTDLVFRTLLEDMDDRFSPAEKATFLEQWKKGYILDTPPFKAETGYFRIRLIDYQPSTPSAVNDADGKIIPGIFETAVTDMVNERVSEIVSERAAEVEQKLRALMQAREKGETAPDADMAAQFDALTTEYIPYMELDEPRFALGRLIVGDLLGPLPIDNGREIVVLVERRIPDLKAYEAETAAVKSQLRQNVAGFYQGGIGFTYTVNGPSAVIQPSPTAMGALATRFNNGQIVINPELLRNENEG